MNLKRSVVLLLALGFALTITVSLASADYVVIKDQNGRCSVRESDHKTPKTIAGPFKTKEEAVKAKEKECATASTPKEKEPGLVDKIKEKAKDKDKAKQELKEKAEKAKQAVKEKKEKALKEKEEKAKQKTETDKDKPK
jgi:outer membrane biosynthesis protein TonB